jgi:hypothetical protein
MFWKGGSIIAHCLSVLILRVTCDINSVMTRKKNKNIFPTIFLAKINCCPLTGSNCRPSAFCSCLDYETDALPTELKGRLGYPELLSHFL